ncbi:hypothetical protein, partial [Streptomyces inhibens]|uniref:hypothetical protein n=1 Tax=Streptomyces inhibens TaxID=2293571 RepID=UPI001C6F4B17
RIRRSPAPHRIGAGPVAYAGPAVSTPWTLRRELHDPTLVRNEPPSVAPVRNDHPWLRKEPALRQVSGGP